MRCDYCGDNVPVPPKERTFEIHTVDGETHVVRATYAFDNGLSGLIFRDGVSPHTTIVGLYAHGQWAYFKELI